MKSTTHKAASGGEGGAALVEYVVLGAFFSIILFAAIPDLGMAVSDSLSKVFSATTVGCPPSNGYACLPEMPPSYFH